MHLNGLKRFRKNKVREDLVACKSFAKLNGRKPAVKQKKISVAASLTVLFLESTELGGDGRIARCGGRNRQPPVATTLGDSFLTLRKTKRFDELIPSWLTINPGLNTNAARLVKVAKFWKTLFEKECIISESESTRFTSTTPQKCFRCRTSASCITYRI